MKTTVWVCPNHSSISTRLRPKPPALCCPTSCRAVKGHGNGWVRSSWYGAHEEMKANTKTQTKKKQNPTSKQVSQPAPEYVTPF